MRKADVRSMAVCAGVATAMLTVAGCSSVPDEVNPAEWYRSASSWISGDPSAAQPTEAGPVAATAPAETAKTYPNLASVPDRPKPTIDPATRRDTIATLQSSASSAGSEAEALKTRAGDEVARRELPMAPPAATSTQRLPAPRTDGLAGERPVAALAMPPAEMPSAESMPRSDAAAPAPQLPAPQPSATMSPAAVPQAPAAPAPAAPPVPATMEAPPVAAMPAASPRATQATFTPGAPVAPRPPVMPPQPLSLRASG